jgi:hypothetical protein
MPKNSDFENGSASASSGASLSKNEIRNTAASDAKIAQGSLAWSLCLGFLLSIAEKAL